RETSSPLPAFVITNIWIRLFFHVVKKQLCFSRLICMYVLLIINARKYLEIHMKRHSTTPRRTPSQKTLAYAIALAVAGFGQSAIAQTGKVEEIFVTARKVEE